MKVLPIVKKFFTRRSKIKNFDKQIKETQDALKYLAKHKKGSRKELESNLSLDKIREFESLGFIGTGDTLNGYCFTKFGKQYYNVIK